MNKKISLVLSTLLVMAACMALLGAMSTVANASTDTVAPAARTITAGTPTSFYVKLSWLAPADNGTDVYSGQATKYELRYSTSQITTANWDYAQEVPFVVTPATVGTLQWKTVSGLMPSTTYYFGFKTIDEAGNASGLTTTSVTTNAQSCDANVAASNLITKVYGTSGTSTTGTKYLGSVAGKVVCLDSISRTNPLELIDMNGTADLPVKIVNNGGLFSINTTSTSYGLKISNSKHFQLTGTGTSSTYGIELQAVGTALQVTSGSTDYEIDHINILGSNFGGMNLKSDLSCAATYDRSNFTQYNTSVHHNRIINVGEEGIYLGHSHYHQPVMKDCDTEPSDKETTLWEHGIEGVRVYNNITSFTGWDGIQVGGATHDVKVYNNLIHQFAMNEQHDQRSGLQINPGTTGHIYNNRIETGYGAAINYQGRGYSDIYNNILFRPTDAGIWIDDRVNPSNPSFYQGPIRVMNNTIIEAGTYGIEMQSQSALNSEIFNNLIDMSVGNPFIIEDNLTILYPNWVVQQGTTDYLKLGTGVSVTQDHNLLGAPDSYYEDYYLNDFHLVSGATLAINQGRNDPLVKFDYDGNPRPYGGAHDIGAYEYTP